MAGVSESAHHLSGDHLTGGELAEHLRRDVANAVGLGHEGTAERRGGAVGGRVNHLLKQRLMGAGERGKERGSEARSKGAKEGAMVSGSSRAEGGEEERDRVCWAGCTALQRERCSARVSNDPLATRTGRTSTRRVEHREGTSG